MEEILNKTIYDKCYYIGMFNNNVVYEAGFKNDEIHYVGFPRYILKNDNNVRWATDKENFEIYVKFNSDLE